MDSHKQTDFWLMLIMRWVTDDANEIDFKSIDFERKKPSKSNNFIFESDIRNISEVTLTEESKNLLALRLKRIER